MTYTNLTPAAVYDILIRYWPKWDATTEQKAALAQEFRSLDAEQVDAIAARVYRTQKSARREPNVRMLADACSEARRENYKSSPEAAGGLTEFQKRTARFQRRLNRVGEEASKFWTWYWSWQYGHSWKIYSAPCWGMSELDHAIWWLLTKAAGATNDLAQCGLEDQSLDDAMAEIVGIPYSHAKEIIESRRSEARRIKVPKGAKSDRVYNRRTE